MVEHPPSSARGRGRRAGSGGGASPDEQFWADAQKNLSEELLPKLQAGVARCASLNVAIRFGRELPLALSKIGVIVQLLAGLIAAGAQAAANWSGEEGIAGLVTPGLMTMAAVSVRRRCSARFGILTDLAIVAAFLCLGKSLSHTSASGWEALGRSDRPLDGGVLLVSATIAMTALAAVTVVERTAGRAGIGWVGQRLGTEGIGALLCLIAYGLDHLPHEPPESAKSRGGPRSRARARPPVGYIELDFAQSMLRRYSADWISPGLKPNRAKVASRVRRVGASVEACRDRTMQTADETTGHQELSGLLWQAAAWLLRAKWKDPIPGDVIRSRRLRMLLVRMRILFIQSTAGAALAGAGWSLGSSDLPTALRWGIACMCLTVAVSLLPGGLEKMIKLLMQVKELVESVREPKTGGKAEEKTADEK